MPTDIVLAVSTRGTSAAIRSITNLDGRTSKLGRTLAGLAVGGAVAATAAVVKFGIASVDAASDSQQSLGATETVFGRFADTVVKRSRRAADAVGLSANEYRELANVVGASLQAAGVPLRKTTSLTDQLNRRAADLAATYGGTTREAIEAVSSLLRGEADPIERYGVSIKQADVNARLAAKGLDDLEGKSRKQAEIQARLDLLFGQTSKSAGAFARESDTLAGAQQRLDAKVENVEARFGKLLLPVLTDGVNLISQKVIPAAEDLADWLAKNQGEITDLAGSVRDGILPPLKTLGGLVGDVAGFFSDLPGPVQTTAVQAGLAAVAVSRLNTAFGASNFSAFLSNLRSAETRTAALSRAARTTAGVGGVVALTNSIGQTNQALKATERIAGGALLGFSVGGPIGGAIGGGAGAAWGLYDAIKHVNTITQLGHEKALKYASALDEMTAALTRQGKAQIIANARERGVLAVTSRLGVSNRDLIGAVNGNEAATRRLSRAYEENFDKLSGPEQVRFNEWLSRNTAALGRQRAETIETSRATTTWHQALKGLPPEVRSKVKAIGTEISIEQLRRLQKRYDLTDRQVNTVVKAIGTEAAIRKVDGVWTAMEHGKEIRPGINPWLDSLTGTLNKGERTSRTSNELINRYLQKSGDTRANIDPFLSSLTGGINTARSRASSGGVSIGHSLGSGLQAGIGDMVTNIANAAANAVATALAAARQRARSKSPSRETQDIGHDLGDGLVLGLNDSHRKTGKAGGKLIDQLLKASTEGARSLQDALRKVLESHKLKGDELRKALKSLNDESRALVNNAKAQDRVNKKLEKARSHLKDLQQQAKDYARSIRDSVVATGDVTQLGKNEEGTATTTGILDQLRAKLRDAQRFADLIRSLTRAGLNATSLQQILAAGVEGGLSTAEAIVAGGSDAIDEINDLTRQLTQTGTQLGNSASETLYEAGIQAAQGLVDGLESRADELDKIADRLAKRLAKAIRKALRIKSPSGLMRDLGRLTGEGFAIGLEDTHAKRVGEVFARDLIRGVGEPKITARSLVDSATPGGSTQTILVELTAEHLSDLEQGRRIQIKLNAFNGNGGRRVARPGSA